MLFWKNNSWISTVLLQLCINRHRVELKEEVCYWVIWVIIRTVLYEFLQVVRVTSQLEDECSSSDLLLDVFIQQLHILIDAVDARLLVQLTERKQFNTVRLMSAVWVTVLIFITRQYKHIRAFLSQFLPPLLRKVWSLSARFVSSPGCLWTETLSVTKRPRTTHYFHGFVCKSSHDKLVSTVWIFPFLQIEKQLLHLAEFRRVNQSTFLHDFPGQRGRIGVGVQAFQANTEGSKNMQTSEIKTEKSTLGFQM